MSYSPACFVPIITHLRMKLRFLNVDFLKNLLQCICDISYKGIKHVSIPYAFIISSFQHPSPPFLCTGREINKYNFHISEYISSQLPVPSSSGQSLALSHGC